jgi:pimeloyl-ACP methyl ester carboxylesterase
MTISGDIPTLPGLRRRAGRGLRRTAIATAVSTAAAAVAASGAGAEIIKKDDMMRGITTTRERCAATAQTLWLNVDKQDFCVRYYLSTAGGEGTRPVVFLQGDYFGNVDPRTWQSPNPQWIPTSKDKNANVTFDPTVTNVDIDTDDLMKMADAFSKMAKTTAIYLARIGVGGTSGNHIFRKTLLELHLMSAALDAIKQRYGFEGFHLAGQSGGSTLVAGLAATRRDIACAVSGSGRLGKSYDVGSKDPARTWVNPLEFVPSIVQNRSVRFFMVTDSADRTVPAKQQTPFAEKMHRAGRDIPQYFVAATDDYHHGVVSYAQLVAGGCVLGKSDADIATAVSTMVKRNAAFNAQRRKEIALFTKNGAASLPPSAEPRAAPSGTRTGGKRA